MSKIQVLSKQTSDQIAAGEVVERPASVVKELVENAIDAGATAVSVETENGGITRIRVTDNGSGIPKEDIPTAFKTHATSKIREISDLETVMSLGFRGEALPSIASVSKVTLITKTKDDFVGTSYFMAGGENPVQEEIGTPDGTTVIVEDLFYNTPARRKFLKTPITENSYVGDILEKFALGHPEIRFKWTGNGNIRLSTDGNGRTGDLIYSIFGRDTAKETIEIHYEADGIKVDGFIGKPVIVRGNRGSENYFINGRFVKSKVVERALEDAYAPFLMQHRYPFALLYLTMAPSEYDVNVHPTKMELRFLRESAVYDVVKKAVTDGLMERELIPDVSLSEEKEETDKKIYEAPEPFEEKRIRETAKYGETKTESPDLKPDTAASNAEKPCLRQGNQTEGKEPPKTSVKDKFNDIFGKIHDTTTDSPKGNNPENTEKDGQMTLGKEFLGSVREKSYRLIGQLFRTYWLIEVNDSLYILDQHAAHEKVLYERFMKTLSEKKISTAYISPPVVITVTEQENLVLNRFADVFRDLGFEIEFFGQKEYAVTGLPNDIVTKDIAGLFNELLSGLTESYGALKKETVTDKIASMSCKAAVKGNDFMTYEEADALIRELLTLQNPYACPHGRPTLISITKTELEKKFKRIV